MYKRYCELRNNKGIKDADVAKATGINRSTFSDWKNGRSTPKQPKLQKIADFFDVTLDYLMTGNDTRFSSDNINLDLLLLTDNDTRDILIEFNKLDSEHKELLKKYMELLKNDMK